MIYNFNKQIPNIFHLQGRSKEHYQYLFEQIASNKNN